MVTKAEAIAANRATFEAVCASCTLSGTCEAERQERQRKACTDALDDLESSGEVSMVSFHRTTGVATSIAFAYKDMPGVLKGVTWEDDRDSCPTVIWYAAVKEAEMIGVPFGEAVDGNIVRLAVIEDERVLR